MALAHEEIFGPVVAISTFESEAAVLARANASASGLAAYFYTADQERVWRMMEALEYGIVGVNTGAVSNEVGRSAASRNPAWGAKAPRHRRVPGTQVRRLRRQIAARDHLTTRNSDMPTAPQPVPRDADAFDYVIVGSGAAASILANRLSADGSTVCVLEAGPPDRSPYLHIPAGFIKAVFNPKYAWQFSSAGSAQTHGRRIPIPQGRTLGGSTSINGLVTTAARPPTSTTGRRWAISAGP